MTLSGKRAQSTLLLIVIAILLVVGVIVFSVGISDGFLNSADGDDPQSNTPTSTALSTATSDAILSQTATSTVAVTPDQLTGTPAGSPEPITVTPTSTPPPPTPTVASTEVPEESYEDFMDTLVGEMAHMTAEPIQARGFGIRNGTLWWTYNATASSESNPTRVREYNSISIAYAQALLFYDRDQIEGEAPDRMRVLEIDNTETQPKTYFVNNSIAREFGSGQIDSMEYTRQVTDTLRNQTESEREWVHETDQMATNATIGPNGTVEFQEDS